MKRWLDPIPVPVPDALSRAIGGHPILAETLAKRGILTPEAAQAFMYWHHYRPASPFELPDMDKAVERLRTAIRQRELICVWGDFDVDGQTSTALLASGLKDLGASVTTYIPQRLREGHGITIDSLRERIDGGAQLILTCDTGVDEHEAVRYAATRDVDVIVTDHHKLPEKLPPAYAVVNPRRTPPDHPLRDLPGVGVAYKLIEALAPDDYDTTSLLDLVALGIVADVAVQQADTRYLLQRGLAVLRDTKRIGLQAMMELAEVNPANLSESDIGFRLAPRLNAIGRLGDANPTTELLTTRKLERARILANQLEGLNAERRRLSDGVWAGVQASLEREPHLLKHAALVVSHPDWHTGVVGIVANRCVEAYDRPAVLLATPDSELARGSARSIAGVDITDAIAANAHLLSGFGGHTMAAGLALDPANLADFRRGLSEQVMLQVRDLDLTPTLHIDRYMALAELDMSLVTDVARIAPFGAGNPPLTLATSGLTITHTRQLGRDARHLELTVEDDVGTTQKVKWWNADEPPSGRFDLAYTVRENVFRGEREVMIEWLDARPAADTPIEIESRPDIAYHDFRNTPNPEEALHTLLAELGSDVQIWAEVIKPGDVATQARHQLSESNTLIVWTIPPDPRTWKSVLERVRPAEVYLFGIDPDVKAAEVFVKRLAGLTMYAINQRQGEAKLLELAAATAQSERAVRAGLMWLETQGVINIEINSDGRVRLMRGVNSEDNMNQWRKQLSYFLTESIKYRDYWLHTNFL
jgi:single-stranded-DNA-specific exonuclease